MYVFIKFLSLFRCRLSMRVLDVKINLKVIIAGHTVFASKCFTECKRARYCFFFVSSAKVVMKKFFYKKKSAVRFLQLLQLSMLHHKITGSTSRRRCHDSLRRPDNHCVPCYVGTRDKAGLRARAAAPFAGSGPARAPDRPASPTKTGTISH